MQKNISTRYKIMDKYLEFCTLCVFVSSRSHVLDHGASNWSKFRLSSISASVDFAI
jgi:hypothetical protein